MTPAVREVFGGLFVALLVASVIGWWLSQRHASAASENLNARIRAWWVMILVGGLTLALGRYAVLVVCGLLSWFAWREFDSVGGRLYWLVPAQYLAQALAMFTGSQWAAVLLLPLCCLVISGWEQRIGLLLCVYGLSWIPALGRAEWILYVVLVVQASDVLQYLWGRAIGRHAVAPRISPSKTVEGLVGGIVSATAIGTFLYYLTPFPPAGAMLAALSMTSAGFLGGLQFSAVKRQRGIKDWGTAITGHGGVLDRVDSLCLSAPLFYLMVRLFAPAGIP